MRYQNLVSRKTYEVFSTGAELEFTGKGYNSAGSYWEPPDGEMEVTGARRSPREGAPWETCKIDAALDELARDRGLTYDAMLDQVIRDLDEVAEYEEPDYPEFEHED